MNLPTIQQFFGNPPLDALHGITQPLVCMNPVNSPRQKISRNLFFPK